jgi:hypothetical protein
MTTRFAIDEQSLVAVTGQQTFSNTDLGSENGEAAIVLCNYGDVLGTIADDFGISAGFIAGANENFVHQNANHNDAAGVDASRVARASGCLEVDTAGTGTNVYSASVNSATTNGFILDVTRSSGNQLNCALGMFNGDGFTAATGIANAGATGVGNDFSVTSLGLGGAPDVVIFFAIMLNGGSYPFQTDSGARSSYAITDGTNTYLFANRLADGEATVHNDGYFGADQTAGNSYCFVNLVSAGPTGRLWEFKQMDSDGFTITCRGAVGNNEEVGFLALRSTDWTFKTGKYDVPTSGSVTESGLGFTPECLIEVITMLESEDTWTESSGDAGAFAIVMNDGTNEYSFSCSMQEGVTTSVAKSHNSADTTVLDHTGVKTSGSEAIIGTTSFASGSFTKTFTEHPAAAKKAFYVAGGPSGTATTIEVPTGPWR